MDSRKRQKIVYAIFFISLIWGSYHLVFKKRESPDRPAPVLESSVILPPAVPLTEPDTGLKFEKWGDDPFAHRQPSIATTPVENNFYFRLSAISEANGVFWAVINGRAVKSGDSLEEWKVVKIDISRAVLVRNGETISLSMEGH